MYYRITIVCFNMQCPLDAPNILITIEKCEIMSEKGILFYWLSGESLLLLSMFTGLGAHGN